MTTRLLVIFLVIGLSASAQRLDEVHHLSTYDTPNTARTIGLGGAQCAMGADLSNIGTNPAGLALYRRSELSITAAIYTNGFKTDYLGETQSDRIGDGVVPNFGLAFTTTDDRVEKGLKSYTFGVTYNRAASWSGTLNYGGLNNRNSFTTYLGEYTTEAVRADPSVLNINTIINPIFNLPQLAWKSELINYEDSVFVGIADSGGVYQSLERNYQGFLNHWDMGLGLNYADKWYVGMGVRIGNYQLKTINRISEVDSLDNVEALERFTYVDDYDIIGTGAGYSIGVIRRIGKVSRVGVGIHTPVLYAMNAIRNYSIEDVLVVRDTLSVPLEKRFFAELEESQFTITTPWRFTVGSYVQWAKKGFLTTDVEYRLMPSSGSEILGRSIESQLRNQLFVRTGAEYRKDVLRFRAGVSVQTNSMKGASGRLFWTQSIGMGMRAGVFLADVYVQRATWSEQRAAYALSDGSHPVASIQNNRYTLGFTIGSKF